jgi:hypothetical protein
VAAIQAVEGYLSPRYISQKIYPEPYPVPPSPPPIDVAAMRTAVQAGLNGGVDILNYVGHGAADRFGRDKYLHALDVAGLSNGSRLPLTIAMTCVSGQYSIPGTDCLAETLLMTPGVGAVATVAPTGLSYDSDAAWISRRLMQVLGQTRGGRLGGVITQTFSLYNSAGDHLTPVWMYNLIGDPALRILVPGA